MERALRNFATAFFFAFPAVFGPVALPLLFLIVPIFGFRIPGNVSYFEGFRLIFLILWAFALASWTLLAKGKELSLHKPDGRTYAVLAFAVPFWISCFSNPWFPLMEAAAGETYSVLPFLSIFFVALSVSAFPKDLRGISVRAFVLGFAIVNLPLSFAQFFGLDPTSGNFSVPWEPGRAYWALGNPNSLAFMAALCLPTVFWVFPKGMVRKAVIAALFAICVFSGSWSGTAVFLGYLAYRYFGWVRTAAVTLAATVSFFAYSQHFQDKRMSAWTRFAIVVDAAERSFSNPRTFFLWDGTSAVEEWFAFHRSAEVTNFVDPQTPIDRTHFFFFDLSLVFWTPFALALFGSAFFLARKTERPAREALSVFFLLSCLHTPTSAHLLFVALLLVNGRPVPKKPVPSAWTA